ncbi:unnamed protein product [Adineta ricciae]|uniref:G-protein coupled receptors family 1 profile domain-containing protein n=1 Tax=Adineta ricciae TaxID=249248 RepID=A0A814AAH2_ADIRI|nr:unnamed protein product [Adineta ricciae]CAF1418578.1 unnamed protein product [Adineta ricciae]
MSLTLIGEQLTAVVGSVFFVVGFIGNGINIFIFSGTIVERRNCCSFYLLTASIINTLYLCIILIPRIETATSGIDLTRSSRIWCKVRPLFTGSLPPMSLTCACLSIIDQFISTSKNFRLRQYSNMKLARRIIIVFLIIWIIHGIIASIFYEITPTRCTSSNAIYAVYTTVYLIVVNGCIPILIISIFGWLTNRNIRQTQVLANRQADRQLTKMILMQSIVVVISNMVYGVNNVYRLITTGVTKDINRQITENFVTTIVTLISYFYSIGSFYIFFISSSQFRRKVKQQLLFYRRQRNQINTI